MKSDYSAGIAWCWFRNPGNLLRNCAASYFLYGIEWIGELAST